MSAKMLMFARKTMDLLREAIDSGNVPEITRLYYKMNPEQAVRDGYTEETADKPPASTTSAHEDA